MVIEPKVVSRLPQWVYKARDMAEFSKHIPRSSPVSGVVHFGMGFAGAAAVIAGGAALMPAESNPQDRSSHSKAEWLRQTGKVGAAASGLTILITAGMQTGIPRDMPLPRGVNPIYFLAVGGFAMSYFGAPKLAEAYES